MNKIYFDLDGVMANFETAVVKATGIHYWDRTVDKHWEVLDKIPNLFYQLAVIPGSLDMLNLVIDRHGLDVVEILTALPKPTNELATAAQDKEDWVSDFVHAGIIVNTIEGGVNKHRWLDNNPGALLIDDYDRNIKAWIAGGGVGILHTDPHSTIEKLKILGLL